MIELNDFNKIIFEGQYLNGELNGVGIKFFHQGLSIIKAHYINGKKNGKCYDYLIDYFDFGENDKHGDDDVYINRKSYFIKPVLLFESEYLNGAQTGKGIEYYKNGSLRFKGEYIHGERNGKGIEYDHEEVLRFEGEYLNGAKYGKGKIYNKSGTLTFEGEFANN